MLLQRIRPGDLLVYRRTEFGTHPAPGARDIAPSANGEGYTYCVTKYWIVVESRSDGTLLVQSRGGHQHEVRADDPSLRKANIFERLWILRRFNQVTPETHQRHSA